eukprot:TRINITY_DN93568_c0_g1_i1.p1 TRINITY_DN93568_c0_g1~~TRINITY_DN93568_c0_g1_i1.p1  ORF type:complete len:212 (-),score=29.49 TRINITY_DN93568_c0_g1_i1:125-676(-)
MATWGGAPLHKNGFWNPSSMTYATPPPAAPWFWAPQGWKRLAREQQAMEAAYDDRYSALEARRPSSASSQRSFSSQASAQQRRKPVPVLAAPSAEAASGREHLHRSLPSSPEAREIPPRPWTMSRADLYEAPWSAHEAPWSGWQRLPAGVSTFQQDRPYTGRCMQASLGLHAARELWAKHRLH